MNGNGNNGTVRLTEATTPQGRFDRALNRQIRDIDKLDLAAAQKVTRLLADARRRIVMRINDTPSEFLDQQLSALKLEVERILDEFQAQYLQVMPDQNAAAVNAGTDFVKKPLDAVGINLQFGALPSQITTTLATFQADKIKGLTASAKDSITTELSMGVLGGSSKADLMASISKYLPSPAGAGTIGGRATRIVRTEVNRIHAVTTQARMETAAEQVPGLKKYWLPAYRNTRPTHAQAGADYSPDRAIPVDQPFTVGVGQGMFPRDPSLPVGEVVNCQCRSVPVVPEVSTATAGKDRMARIQKRVRQGKFTKEAEVVALGADVRAEALERLPDFKKRQAARMAQLEAEKPKLQAKVDELSEQRGKARTKAFVTEKTPESVKAYEKMNAVMDKAYDDYFKVQNELYALKRRQGAELVDATREVLAEVRPIGWVEQRWAKAPGLANAESVKEHLRGTGKNLPEAWLEKSKRFSAMVAKRAGRSDDFRSFHNPQGVFLAEKKWTWRKKKRGKGYVHDKVVDKAPNDIASVALHEMGHRMEMTVPGLADLTEQYHVRRTTSASGIRDPLEKMSDVTGIKAYRDNELTRKNKYPEAYMGKEYDGRRHEIITVGLEGVFFNRHQMWAKDPETVDFILGLLAGVP